MFRCIKMLVFLAVVAVILFFGHGVILDKAGRYLHKKDELKPADVIVVLGGEVTERVDYAVRLYKDEWAKKDRMIMCGGPVVWKYTWASAMKEQAVSLGIPKQSVILEDQSRSTEEDAKFTREIVRKHGYTSILLVTSPYHSRRASLIFERSMGDTVRIISAPVQESWFSFDDWWKRRRDRAMVLNEYSKFLWLLLFGIV